MSTGKTDVLVHDLRAYHGACGRCAEAADEIERLKAENEQQPEISYERLRAEVERVTDENEKISQTENGHWRMAYLNLEAEVKRLRAREKTLENTAKINLKVAQDRGAEVERLYEECAIIAETEPEPKGPVPKELRDQSIREVVCGTVRATRKCIAQRIRARAALEGRG
jgi:hypothetical protein